MSEDCLRERERARAELFLPSWLSHFRAEVQTRCFRKKTNKKTHTKMSVFKMICLFCGFLPAVCYAKSKMFL